MKVFLDVGAHQGQTLLAALRWNFDRIVCFEPAAENVRCLRELGDERTEICHFGLWSRTGPATLFDTGSQGASLWKRPGRATTPERCVFTRASDWMRAHIKDGDQVWMKLNAEGAELDIITDLLDSGEMERISYSVVMWDAHKIPAVAPRLAAVKARLAGKYDAPRVVSSKDVKPALTHVGRIDSWLKMTKGVERL